MTYYEQEINRIDRLIHANQEHVQTVIRIRNYIDTHYDTEVNLDALSQRFFLSKYHLLRLFKRYYGLTPRQYLIDKRIAKSKDLLTDGLSVTETCFAVGFESLGSFSSLFKVKTGKSPTKFRNEQLSRSQLNPES